MGWFAWFTPWFTAKVQVRGTFGRMNQNLWFIFKNMPSDLRFRGWFMVHPVPYGDGAAVRVNQAAQPEAGCGPATPEMARHWIAQMRAELERP